MASSSTTPPTTPTTVPMATVISLGATNAIHIPLDGIAIAETKTAIFLVVDKSGSMSGARMQQVREGLTDLMPMLFSASAQPTVGMILYDSSARIVHLQETTWRQQISGLSAGGGTSFEAAFVCLKTALAGVKSRIKVVFMTDGEDSSPVPSLEAIRKMNLDIEYHVISVGASAQNEFLIRVMNAGSTIGSFQRTEEVPIAACIDGVSSRLVAAKVSAHMLGRTYQLAPIQGAIGKYGMIFLDADLPLSGWLIVGETRMDVSVSANPNPSIVVDTAEAYINRELQDIARNIQTAPVDVAHKRISDLGELLTETKSRVGALRVHARRLLTPRLTELGQTLRDFVAILAERSRGGITNETLAKLNHLAHRGGLKKRDAARLDERMLQNIPKVEKHENEIEEFVRSLEVSGGKPRLANGSKIPRCFMTMESWRGLLKSGDCLCLSVNFGRSPATAMNPWSIRVFEITPSFISARSLMERMANAIDSSTSDGIDVHGGFSKTSGNGAVVGVAREQIGGGIVLGLTDDHWYVARRLAYQLYGQACVLDPFGFTEEMTRAVPFMALAKAIRMEYEVGADNVGGGEDVAGIATIGDVLRLGGEHAENIVALLMDVCIRLYADSIKPPSYSSDSPSDSPSARWSQDVIRIANSYASDPSVRTKDVLPSTEGFLSQVLVIRCAGGPIGYKSVDLSFFRAVLLEETRRSMVVPAGKTKNEYLGLNGLVAKYVDPHIDHYISTLANGGENDGEETYASRFFAISGGAPPQRIAAVEMSPSTAAPKTFVETFRNASSEEWYRFLDGLCLIKAKGSNGHAVPSISPAEWPILHVLDRLMPLFYRVYGFRGSTGQAMVTSLRNVPYVASFSAFIQCLDAQTNSDCREMIAAGRWRDPFSHSADILFDAYRNAIDTEIASRKTAVLAQRNASTAAKDASIFARTKDMNVAAGAIMGSKTGTNVRVFFDALLSSYAATRPDDQAFCEKLDMLLSGRWKGVQIRNRKRREVGTSAAVLYDDPWNIGYSLRKRVYRLMGLGCEIFASSSVIINDHEREVAERWARG